MSATSRRAEHVADTRAALVSAARELFAERGYADVGTAEIVGRARVTRGALYHHFRDKADLFQAVMRAVAAELAGRLVEEQTARTGAATAGVWDQLRHGVQAYLDACVGSDFQRIVLVDGPAVLGPAAWEALVQEYGLGLLRDWLGHAIEDGQIDVLPVDPLARLLAALIAEASVYIGGSTDQRTARDETGRTLDRVLVGLRPSGAGS
ncbi:MAG: TetR/AcrR family transcriptional regulator [Streptosporangiales bacterium]